MSEEKPPLFNVANDFDYALPPITEIAESENTGKLTDKEGREYDPDIHMADKSGNPLITRDGFLRRKPGVKAKPVDDVSQDENPEAVKPEMAAVMSGEDIISLFENFMKFSLGDSWEIKTPEQRIQMGNALEKVMRKRGLDYELSPEMELAFCLTMYAAPRMTMEENQKSIGGIFRKVGGWIVGAVNRVKGAFKK